MIIETKYNLGDSVWYFTKDGVDSGTIDSIEIATYNWWDFSEGKETVIGPEVTYKMGIGRFGGTGKYREDQLWSSREEMPI